MSAPSLLADNPSARIEIVQGGGGMVGGEQPSFTESELKILTQYGLHPGGRLDTEILPEIKKQFLEQVSKSNCAIGTGDNVILNSECSAVAQVIRAMINTTMKRTNGWAPKSLKLAAKPPAPPGMVAAPPVSGRTIDTSGLLATIRARINSPHAGLDNCGNTCYLNSVLQMLSYVPEFVDESNKNGDLYSIFRDLYSSAGPVNLQLNNRLKTVFGGIFPVLTEQQDATEFIIRLFRKYDISSSYFNIRQIQSVTCDHPPPSILGLPGKTPVEALTNHITLPVENGNSIDELLNNIQRAVDLDNVADCLTPNTDAATGPAKQTTRFEIPEENRYLLISLSRFRNTGRTEKDARGADIPVYERIDTPITINTELELGGVEYSLYGTVLQTGTIKGGHYRFLKVNEGSSGIMYNDTSVTEIPDTVDMNQNTYIAIYKRDSIPVTVPAAAEATEPSPAHDAAPEAAPAGPAVVGAMPNVRASSMEAEPEENLNAPASNENAPAIIQGMVDMLMTLEPGQRKITSKNGIDARVGSTRVAINSLPDGTPSGLTRDDITPTGQIKTDRIKHIMKNFTNYSKADLSSVVEYVKRICLAAIKDGGVLNSGDDVRIRQALKIVEELLRDLELLEYNIKQHSIMSAPPEIPFANTSAAANVNYPDEYYEENPSNFQPGHLRINFEKVGHAAPGNRRVYANTVVGTRRTRIYGTNAANIKKKYDARTRKLRAVANRAATAAAAASRVANETRAAAAKAKNIREAAARAANEAKRTLKTMQNKAAKNAAEAAKAAIRDRIAAGEKVSFMNRMKAKFGGTRRKTRGSRKSRRGGRK